MEVLFYNLSEDEMKKIDELENTNPDIVVKTVLAGFDSGIYTELIFEAIPSLIEAIGTIVAAFIVARATVQNDNHKDDKKEAKTDIHPREKSKKIIVKTDDGKEHEIETVEELYKVLDSEFKK